MSLISFPLFYTPLLRALLYTAQKSHYPRTIHQVTTMLATSQIVLCPGHNHLLTTITDDPTLSEGDN